MREKMKVKLVRDSNIELARILAIIGVIILHYNNPEIGGAFNYADKGSYNYYILYFLESISICAVNLFVLISGFFMYKTKSRNLMKPFQLLSQVIIFSGGIYLLKVLLGKAIFSPVSFVKALIPNNYFVILYIVLYFISPYLNIVFENLTEKKMREMVVILFLIFSI